ncbi:MAG TPA: hypothetical protein VF974_05980 [Patescibacteria group bacterium]
MTKQWGDLTLLEQRKRELLASEGIVCGQCGKSVSSIVYWCDDCQKQHEQECETDIHENRSYDENGEEHIQLIKNDTGELLDEFTTVSLHDDPTSEQLQAMLDWAN